MFALHHPASASEAQIMKHSSYFFFVTAFPIKMHDQTRQPYTISAMKRDLKSFKTQIMTIKANQKYQNIQHS